VNKDGTVDVADIVTTISKIINTIIMDLKEYISTVNQKYRAGNATEHTYRGALEQLMETLLPKLRIVNEPKR
jgi:hypothetical protein